MNLRPSYVACSLILVGCGSRTGLLVGEEFDASFDASVDVTIDSVPQPDVVILPDQLDAPIVLEVGPDVPPIDLCKGVFCSARNFCHLTGTCDPATGVCSEPTKPNGTRCDDGNPNTVDDVCAAGICAGTDHCLTTACVAKDQCHVPGVCLDHATGRCSDPIKPNGSSCDDGNPDTVNDVCMVGVCQGVDQCRGVLCQPADMCHTAGVCDHATGLCHQAARPDGTPCDDGSKKTIDDACKAGVCAGVPACPTSTLIYVLSNDSDLYSFYPPTLAFRRIGRLSCTDASTPFSMAVGRDGIGYTVFGNGDLFQFDTKTASCSSTAYVAGQNQFTTFGMAFTADTDPTRDALYVMEVAPSSVAGSSRGLGRIDTQTMVMSLVGTFSPPMRGGELSGSADGTLYGMHHNLSSGHVLTEIDKSTAKIVSTVPISAGGQRSALAFAFWGGSFWIFTSESGPSTITRYDPATKTETNVGTAPAMLVGAGVSPCND